MAALPEMAEFRAQFEKETGGYQSFEALMDELRATHRADALEIEAIILRRIKPNLRELEAKRRRIEYPKAITVEVGAGALREAFDDRAAMRARANFY